MEVGDDDCLGSALSTEASWRDSVETSSHDVGLQMTFGDLPGA
jgi:hypothetical protein